ncbi:MAG: hypothetical protein M3R70_04565 [Actinomycetota bacterium]|nr:hypothetical protein [Actinomycetota bacterium]
MSALQGILASPKVNRYLPWAAGFMLLAGVAAFLIAYVGNSVNTNERVSNEPAQTEQSLGKAIALPEAAMRVAAQFIDAGVRGNNPQLAYRLSGPDIRGEYSSLAQWMRDWNNPNLGVPITPYPAAAGGRIKIDYARERQIQLKLYLSPRKGVNMKSQAFIMVLDRKGTGPNAPWIVGGWQTYAPPAIPSQH